MTTTPNNLFVTILAYGVVGAFLFAPFYLTYIEHLEPYPAVIMPGGASVIDINKDELTFGETSVLVEHADGSQTRITPSTLLDPIPNQYFHAIINRQFGIAEPNYHSVRLGVWELRAADRPRVSDSQRQEVSAWLRQQLNKAGIDDATALHFVQETVSVNTNTGDRKTIKAKDEFTISLGK